MGSNDVGKLYPAAKAVLTPLFRAAWRFDLRGLENVPASGRFSGTQHTFRQSDFF